jgi:catechol 2,3-dioxygenase-like lactoylglutathione lyase family enzyme
MTQIHHIALRTRDVARLTRFYEGVLALRRLREQPGYSVWLDLGGAVLMIEQAGEDEPPVAPGTRDLLALRVDDAGRAAVLARLTAAGGALEAETQHTSYFRDPDGRRVAVSTHPLS